MEETTPYRLIQPKWGWGLIVASIAVSLLGAFTSTQLMCQAKTARNFSGVLLWTVLGSLTFGFCSIWSFHEVAMLACEIDLPLGLDVPLTVLSAFLAVGFTFASLASDLLLERYRRLKHRKKRARRRNRSASASRTTSRNISRNQGDSQTRDREESAEPLLYPSEQEETYPREDLEMDMPSSFQTTNKFPNLINGNSHNGPHSVQPTPNFDPAQPSVIMPLYKDPPGMTDDPTLVEVDTDFADAEELVSETTESLHQASSDHTSSRFTDSRRSSSYTDGSTGPLGVGSILNMRAFRKPTQSTANIFVATGKALWAGSTPKNIFKGLIWSFGTTSMHYVGLWAIRIPEGHITLTPILVLLSATIGWAGAVIGCILMPEMETNLAQQFLFSAVATSGVAAKHFTGMQAAKFWSRAPPSEQRGYPPGLAVAIASIAIATCIMANGLLAHSATVSRNKLAEIVWTRRKLWMAIAQKENAESAALARSEFIASASHEIRTPLHHLQGYSDLLSRTELTEEGRLLLYAIQRATKTLSLITNNVLDWSRLERDGETTCRPVALDMRTVCESVITLLPNRDEDIDADLMVVVSPDVPDSLFLDETYIHRILMNLLSNALKFTTTGYILVLVEMKDGRLSVTVEDTGTGVPPSFLPQLFEPFTQAQTRGSQRGTGLGLSIIKQLLHKMDGEIEVQSRHQEAEEIQPDQTGSTFNITLPAQLAQPHNQVSDGPNKIAIFHAGNKRSLDGLCSAWNKFGFEVSFPNQVADIGDPELKYVWADIPYLRKHPTVFYQLLEQDRWLVLVPYDHQSTLQEMPALLSSSQFLPIQKPLIWHSIRKSLLNARNEKSSQPRTVRFASTVDVMEKSREEVVQKLVVLLVEDNLINRKLGIKMLSSLGYQVLTAEDGEEAIEQMLTHDETIDIVLMDQSMPRMDGVTATKEIRAMEASGKLSRRRPIIAVTAVVSPQAQTTFKMAGADDFLSKPLSLKMLEQTLAIHVSLLSK